MRSQTHGQTIISVHVEHPDRCSSCPRQPNDLDAAPEEVVGPPLSARIEQFRNLVGFWIDSSEIAALVKVAVDTCQGKILVFVRSAMLSGNDVLDLQSSYWRLLFRKLTVLATKLRTLTDLLARTLIHHFPASDASIRRACACSTAMNLLAWA